MNRLEQERFIEREIKGLWPQWQPKEAAVRVWMAELAALDYPVARTAVQACYRGQKVNGREPVLGRFLEWARGLSPPRRGSRRDRPDPTTSVFIECSEPPAGKPRLAGVRKPVFAAPPSRWHDPDHVWACAQSMRVRFEQLYGGRWIAVRTRPSEDDGLRGEPARQRAYELILAGPDTPARRWLVTLLAERPASDDVACHAGSPDPRGPAPFEAAPTLGRALPPVFRDAVADRHAATR